MRAVTIQDEQLVVEDRPDPEPGRGELLVRVRAAGLNGGARRFAEGDRVMAIVGGGGQAELAVLHERAAMPVPEGMEWPQAGGLPEGFTTAHHALFSQAGLRPGGHPLVHGGAGGVGTAAVQLGRAAGARVTATVRREELRGGVEDLGARAIAPEGFEGEGPFDVILELVGASNLAGNLEALATGGRKRGDRGGGAGAEGEIKPLPVMQKRAPLPRPH